MSRQEQEEYDVTFICEVACGLSHSVLRAAAFDLRGVPVVQKQIAHYLNVPWSSQNSFSPIIQQLDPIELESDIAAAKRRICWGTPTRYWIPVIFADAARTSGFKGKVNWHADAYKKRKSTVQKPLVIDESTLEESKVPFRLHVQDIAGHTGPFTNGTVEMPSA